MLVVFGDQLLAGTILNVAGRDLELGGEALRAFCCYNIHELGNLAKYLEHSAIIRKTGRSVFPDLTIAEIQSKYV